jgi:nucleoside-diphosphate-sugar epimerase
VSERVVLVTGGNGYLGRLLVRRYLDGGATVVATARGQAAGAVARDLGVPVVAADLGDDEPFAAVDDAWRRRITTVVHAAAVTRFNVDGDVAQRVNVEGTQKALELARTCPALESFAHVSTVYATGLRAGPVLEQPYDDTPGFANAYERSKAAAEALVVAAEDVPWRILRVATVVADDDNGTVTQYNAVHETLKLWFYGLLSLVPGRGDTPLYLVTGRFVADAVARLTDPAVDGGVYHVAHDRSESLTLDRFLDVASAQFGRVEEFARKRILRPLLADEDSFALLVDGVTPFAGGLVTSALDNVMPFARQLYVNKELDNTRLRAALGAGYAAPDAAALVAATCARLAATRWGRRLVDA